ncbi:MAG: family 10 glycosylhydrolase [Clostridia bacterium]|nr:family 10 glycosylhydrolase [Clostridia bacterium]
MNHNPQNDNLFNKEEMHVSAPEKTKRSRLLPAVTAATVALLALATFLTFRFVGKNSETPTNAADNVISAPSDVAGTLRSDEMRGVWIATVDNINFPSEKGLSASKMKKELDSIVSTAKNAGLNTLFFQVVPCSDAFYRSEIYPWSEFLTGTAGGDPGFDPLEYITKSAHDAGLELHAWINPFRITYYASTEFSSLPDDHPARLHPEYCVKYSDGRYYYNPALPEVRKMISSEAAYIAKKYDVDGIHMDDYFYPYPVKDGVFDDAAQYALCTDGTSLDDWRRQNVNATVKAIYDAVKAADPECAFGVSPFGIYSNAKSNTPVKGSDTNGFEAYSEVFCDAIAWARGGYVDYLAPQVYWAFSTSAAPFDVVSRWWNANLDGTGVDLYIGHALYKISDFPAGEIPSQIEFARSLMCYEGSIFFGYEDLAKNTLYIADKLSEMYSLPVPSFDANSGTSVNYPADGYKTTLDSQYILGSSETGENSAPVTVNGDPASRTKEGFFGYQAQLSPGENTVEVTQGDVTVTHTVTKTDGTAAPIKKTLASFDITDTYPAGEMWIRGGEAVTFKCTAPAGCNVTVTVGGASAQLSPTTGAVPENGLYIKEVYKGTIKFSTLAPTAQIADLGTITFTAESGGISKTKKCGLMKQVGEGALIYAQVNRDYTYLKKSATSSFYDDYTPTSAGMRDYIVGYDSGFYKLSFGGFVAEDRVTVVTDQPLYKNTVLTAESEVVSSKAQNYKDNYTEFRFGVTENVPVDVWVNGSNVTIVLYDTLPDVMPKFNLVENPLFSSVSAKPGASGKTVLYTAVLKDPERYFGFNLEYEPGFIKIKFNNPIGLSGNAELPLEGKRIYVDAGHGGNDGGALGPGGKNTKLHESHLNLMIANSLAEKLKALGAEIYTTRTEDVTHDLYARLDMISAVVPDLLISVHHNSVPDGTNAQRARGYLGLYSNNSGILLAKTVSDTVCASLNRQQRETAYQKLAMARDHRFPSTLCEMSFISNVEEYQWTLAEGNIERSAQALCDGILEFFRKQENMK